MGTGLLGGDSLAGAAARALEVAGFAAPGLAMRLDALISRVGAGMGLGGADGMTLTDSEGGSDTGGIRD